MAARDTAPSALEAAFVAAPDLRAAAEECFRWLEFRSEHVRRLRADLAEAVAARDRGRASAIRWILLGYYPRKSTR